MVKKQSHCQPSLWSFRPQFCSDFWKCHLGCWIWILESHNTEYKIQIFSRTTYWWIRSCRVEIERHCQSRTVQGSILASSDTFEGRQMKQSRRKDDGKIKNQTNLDRHCSILNSNSVGAPPKESVGAPDQMTVSQHSKSEGWPPLLSPLPHPVCTVICV